MLELSDRDVKITIINILKGLVGNVDDTSQVRNFRRNKIHSKRSLRNAKNEKHYIRMKNYFDGLISRLDTRDEKICKAEGKPKKIIKLKHKEKKRVKKLKGASESCVTESNVYATEITEEENRKKYKK